VFEDRLLRIFVSNYSDNQIKKVYTDMVCSKHGREVHTEISYGNLKERGNCKNPMCRWKDNTKMDDTEMGWEGVDWIHLLEGKDQRQALVNTIMNLRVL
jgi:hypothetical protein